MIRYANISDLDDIYKLICDSEEEKLDFEIFKKIYEKELIDKENTFLIYEKENQVMGLCHMKIDYHLHHCAKICDVRELIVKDTCRSWGIGKLLLEKAIDLAKENNCLHIELSTNQRRKKAHCFYENNGFIQDHYGYTMKFKKR